MSVITSSLRMVKAGTGAATGSRTLTWLVKCTSPADSAANVYANDVTPKRWDDPPSGHDIPANYVCWTSSVTPHEGDSLYWFEITAEYSFPPLTIFPNPLAYIAKGGGGADYFVDTDYDRDGAPIVNTAKDFVDPPFQKPENGGSFWIEFRKTSITGWGIRSHVMNTSAIWGFAEFQIKTGKIEWFRGIEDGVMFWQIRVPFDYLEEGFKILWPSRGFNYLDGANKRAITLSDGTLPNIPQPLDSLGATVDDPIDAHQIETVMLKEADMAAWGMPHPFALND